jgi:Tol biopolymer transport system component
VTDRRARWGTFVVAAVVAPLVTVWPASPAGAATTTLASRDAAGGSIDDPTPADPLLNVGSSLSANGGAVAFLSPASDIVAGVALDGVTPQAYLRDLGAGRNELASRASGGGAGANSFVEHVQISGDGRYVVFATSATNLLPAGQAPAGGSHVYRYDSATDTVAAVDVGPGGAWGDGDARYPSISDDGRWVAYSSAASNLVAGVADGGGLTDIFLRDMGASGPGATRLVSHAAGAPTTPANRESESVAISGTGRFIAYASAASNVVAGISDANGTHDVFRYDVTTQTAALVSNSAASVSATPNSRSDDVSISPNGRFVVFESHSSDVVPGVIDQNTTGGFPSGDDVFIRDLTLSHAELVSATAADPLRTGAQRSWTSPFLGTSGRLVSDDGRYVVFGSPSADLGGDPSIADTNGVSDVFVRDRARGVTVPLSVRAAGGATGGNSSEVGNEGSPTITADGLLAAFSSTADDLVVGDGNGKSSDVFLRTIDQVAVPNPPPAPNPPPPDTPPAGDTPEGYWMLTDAGVVYGFGPSAVPDTDVPSADQATVDIEAVPGGGGYWILRLDGTIGRVGFAAEFACSGGVPLGERATSLSATPDGTGLWIFTDRGRTITCGTAPNFGDVSNLPLNGPVLDSVTTATGLGYYMVASDGGVFAFGDARFHGSMGGIRLNQPVQSLVPTATNGGYWLVASDGGIFAFGDAPFRGSMGATPLNQPVSGMVRFADGYLMVAEDGGIFNFSSQPFYGSLPGVGISPARPVIAVTAAP